MLLHDYFVIIKNQLLYRHLKKKCKNSVISIPVNVILCIFTALEVIGGRTTTVQGGAAVLHCKLIGTTETLTQISWQRLTRGKPRTDNFYTISSRTTMSMAVMIGLGSLGVLQIKGTLQLSNVTLMDEGTYTCVFTLFPSGIHETAIPLIVPVPPVTSLKDAHPALGNDEVPLITCTAAGSKPPAEVRWLTGTLGEKVRPSTNSSLHANGTTTTVSWLFGVPTRELNDRSVQCVITIVLSVLSIVLTFRSDRSWPQSGVRVDGSTLQFLSITSELNGLYQCEASNSYGSKHAYLRVHFTSGEIPFDSPPVISAESAGRPDDWDSGVTPIVDSHDSQSYFQRRYLIYIIFKCEKSHLKTLN
uniref:Ig-like domain-containing protein n=1 Tax=Labrus bergylta TaxID=56723 RepID=A0A3Q3FGB9_9LABR